MHNQYYCEFSLFNYKKKILINQEQALQFTSNKFISGKEVEYIVLKWYDTIVRV